MSAAKQHPHRPGIAPALGLRAGSDGSFILSQAIIMTLARLDELVANDPSFLGGVFVSSW